VRLSSVGFRLCLHRPKYSESNPLLFSEHKPECLRRTINLKGEDTGEASEDIGRRGTESYVVGIKHSPFRPFQEAP